MVLGHERCGAVEASVQGGGTSGHIGTVVKAIRPAVEAVKGQIGDLLANAVKAHVQKVVGQLRASQPVLAELVKREKLKIVGACYELESGVVDFIS